jgi:hypothetical protein
MQHPLSAVSAAIDAANAADPNRIVYAGAEHPRAELEGRRARHWLDLLRTDAADPLRLAAHAHHIRRWEVPRDSQPHTRQGYLDWRSGLYRFHAKALGELMQVAGYSKADRAEAARVMLKRDIKTDIDAQSYEDAVSLAFLEIRLADFAQSVTDERLMRALRRTWAKMSEAGRAFASELDLSSDAAAMVGRALAADR